MTKTILPLMSLEARGTFFGKITFSQRKNNNIARLQKKQVDFYTPARLYARLNFRKSYDWFVSLSLSEQQEFEGYTKEDI